MEHPKVVGTPHLGASTKEAQLKVAQEIAQQFVAAVKGEGLNGVVRMCDYIQYVKLICTYVMLSFRTNLKGRGGELDK